ncbi:hypothetical protein AAVH_10024 [Aphelenchoides avenae]|nr:hypothetical protein AAVH_10024 [Aphelenchus avenae]
MLLKVLVPVFLLLSCSRQASSMSLSRFIETPAVRQFLSPPQTSVLMIVKKDQFDSLSHEEKMQLMRRRLVGYPFGPKSSYIRFG